MFEVSGCSRLIRLVQLMPCMALLVSPAIAQPRVDVTPAHDFLIYYGGGRPLANGDLAVLKDLDLLVVDRFRYREIPGGTWRALRRQNPELKIFIYQDGPRTAVDQDHYQTGFLNNIGRYKTARGLAAGSVAVGHPDWMLSNAQNSPIHFDGGYVLLDFGDPGFRRYWLDATLRDIVSQPWAADGVFMDNSPPYPGWAAGRSAEKVPVPYLEPKAWNLAMNGFVSAIGDGLHGAGQQLMVNRGHSRFAEGSVAWSELDHTDSPPDIVLEEAAFAVSYGSADVQFYPEAEWWRQVQAASMVNQSSVAYLSHARLGVGDKGKDLQGREVTFEQVYMFSLGSYLLALRTDGPPSYFSYDPVRGGAYRTLYRMPLFDQLGEIGVPGSPAYMSREAGGVVYRRQFPGAEVVVNPGDAAVGVTTVTGQRMRINSDGDVQLDPVRGALYLGPHEAAVVLRPVLLD
jgi:hypothetical protein